MWSVLGRGGFNVYLWAFVTKPFYNYATGPILIGLRPFL